MSGLLALLSALLPALMPLITSLINKPKKAFADWARDGAKAHAAQKNTAAAFWLGSLACAADGWTDAEWDAFKVTIPAAAKSFQAYAAANPSKGGAA